MTGSTNTITQAPVKLAYIVGNRPQFIKLAMLHRQVKNQSFLRETIIHTGQHFSDNMNGIFFRELGIAAPMKSLNINSLSHVSMIARMMEAIEGELLALRPDAVIVFGDTNTTLAGALTAKKTGIPVMHIEAGIRTGDDTMPEESNRYLTDRLSAINFCCTETGVENLRREGYTTGGDFPQVIFSGDIMFDAYLHHYSRYAQPAALPENLQAGNAGYLLATIHRKQNVDHPASLSEITAALNRINRDIPVICPLHPNTAAVMKRHGIVPAFNVTGPVGYIEMQRLLHSCTYVITDSGGLQREAFFAKKPALILMEKPFWPEVISYGSAISCKSNGKAILQSFEQLIKTPPFFTPAVFGSGNAAAVIVEKIIHYFAGKPATPNPREE
jgi:UDP-GlcNAc3NAcA epimerase